MRSWDGAADVGAAISFPNCEISHKRAMNARPETAIITIERIVAGGFGLGRHEGKVLLVSR